jgi:hypothetical protein
LADVKLAQKTGLSEEAIEKIIFTEDRNKGNKETALDFWSFISESVILRLLAVQNHRITKLLHFISGLSLQSTTTSSAYATHCDMLREDRAHGPLNKIRLFASGCCHSIFLPLLTMMPKSLSTIRPLMGENKSTCPANSW